MAKKTEIPESPRIGRPPLPESDVLRPRSFGVSEPDWRRWHQAAAAEGMTLSEWLRGLANQRADEVL